MRYTIFFASNRHASNRHASMPTPYSLPPTPYSLLPTPYSLLPNNPNDLALL
ncbi:hypothetical protein [Moorena sp. SIO3H5]|uniref:hypothetical protein n=1 Tax=Moorena sp. SIO3H5 TaxID=2607834 RepID=UPI0013BB93AE|nr:hypothetical protein [Moorena sp. SIO3H5]NEO70167.1 hypothetical protein [Moorena sp. SIO3H5]